MINNSFRIRFLKSRINLVVSTIFLVGLIYVILPGPSSIDDFSPLPGSVKSDLAGDTWQNPNIAAYFSDFDRAYITEFYRDRFAGKFLFGTLFPPLTLNHPPEYAYTYIRDQQFSTFLEEYTYPLRGSLFVNGYEPVVENNMFNKPHNFVADHIYHYEIPYDSKTTLRFYSAPFFYRILVYLGIWFSILAIYRISLKALKE